MNKEERTQHSITPQMKYDISSFWKKYKADNNIADNLVLILIDRSKVTRWIDEDEEYYTDTHTIT